MRLRLRSPRRRRVFSTIGSTNDVAATLAARRACEGAVVIADAQTAGRGRRGATGSRRRAAACTCRGAGAGSRATGAGPCDRAADAGRRRRARRGDRDVRRASPRDQVAERPAGRPPQARRHPGGGRRGPSRPIASIVLGYGINVGPMAYPPELRDRATSLESELGRPVDRAALCAESLAALAARYDDLLAGRFDAILDAWRRRAPAQSRRARHVGHRPSGRIGASPPASTSTARCSCGRRRRVERVVAGDLVAI